MIRFKDASIALVLFLFTIAPDVWRANTVLADQKQSEQSKQSQPIEEDQQEYLLEGMTITAEKREKNIQEVPASITALSQSQRKLTVLPVKQGPP
jgi:hypothetical protein